MPKEKQRIRVLPCTDSSVHAPRFREQCFEGLGQAAGIELLPLALAAMLPSRVQRDRPDVIVIVTEHLRGAAWTNEEQLTGIFTAVPALLLAPATDPATCRRAEQLAIQTVLPWDVTTEQLIAALNAAHAGLAVSLAVTAKERQSDLDALTTAELPDQLTAREVQVLRLMALGMGNRQIAGRLAISEHTAKFHVSQVLAKLGAASRTEAVSLGITHGLVTI